MWFTRVSLKNPVFATMVMLAIVVLGLFSLPAPEVDQFPNIDFPVVVVQTEYPGASPEIVESEVTKKVEEGVNSIAGINALTSRSYEGQSVVIIEFQLHIDGRKAAEDVREKVAAIRPTFRDEVKEPRVLRFDPPAAPSGRWPCCPTPPGQGDDAVELTNWADQVLKKRLENVRGVGSVTLVGGTKREINLYLNPQAMEALGITADQVVNAVRNENQDLPVGAIRSLAQERVVQIDARMERPEDFGKIIVGAQGRRAGARRPGGARRRRRAGSRQPGALQRPAHAAAVGAEGAGREHHRRHRRPEAALAEMQAQLPPACGWNRSGRLAADPRGGRERAPHADRGRAAHGADRVPVPELVALHGHHRPDAADRADRHLPVHVRLRLHGQHGHADGAVAVRGPADRRRHRGAREHRAPRADGQGRPTRPRWTARRRSAWRCWPPPSPSSRCSCPSASWAASSASSSTSSASPSWRRC
jgi:hypothetical protein